MPTRRPLAPTLLRSLPLAALALASAPAAAAPDGDANPAAPPPDTTPTPGPAPAPAPAPAPGAAHAAPAPAADDQDLLAHLADEPDADAPAAGAPGGAAASRAAAETFGTQLHVFGIETTWSGYGDVAFTAVPSQRVATFDASHFNPILSVRMSDDVSGELELEFEHGGGGINVEYAMIDWTPLGSRALVVRVGKFLVPFGRFNEQLHPSFRWAQIARPLMMTEVIPVEWSDVGVQVRGQLGSGAAQLAYAAYVVNGLDEHPGAAVETDEGQQGFIAGLRSNLADSNYDKGLGARAELRLGRGDARNVSVGVSGYTGRTSPAGDPDGPERLTLAGADVALRVGALFGNAEVAQAFFGSQTHGYWQRFERGAYLQLGVVLGRTTLAARYDVASLGSQQGGVVGALTDTHELVGTLRYAPAPSWSVRAEVAEPVTPGGDHATRLAAALTFVF